MILSYFYKVSFPLIFFSFLCAAECNAQAIDPQKAEADRRLRSDQLYYDAVKAKMLGEDKQQETLLKQFIKERPDVAAAYYDLAVLDLDNNRTSDAETHIKKALSLDKENIWYKGHYAEVLKRQKRYEEAAKMYAELAETSDFNRNYYYEAAASYRKEGKYKEALDALDKLMQSSFADDLVLLLKQEVYLKMNDVDGALKVAQELVERNPKDGKYLSNLAEIYNSNGKPEKALQVYQDAIRRFPDDPVLQNGLADYYKKAQDSVKYDEYITKTILNPNLDETTQAYLLQSYLVEVGEDSVRKKKALDMAKSLVEQQPESALMQAFYGSVLARNGQPEEAAKYLKLALESDPAKYDLWQELLLVYVTSNNPDSLLASSKKALRYFPNNAIIHYFNGIAHLNKKDYTDAVKSLNRAIDLQPEDNTLILGDMYSSLGDAYNFLKEFERSDNAYEKALSLNKDNASVLNNYSYYLSLRNERLKDAEKMSKRSLELRPDEPTFLDTYGWILYKQGKYPEAKEYIEKAIKANPAGDGTLFEHLGDIWYKLHDIDKAVENWKRAKERGADDMELLDKKIQERKLYE